MLAGYGAYLVHTMHVRARDARQFNQYRLRDEIGAGGMGEVYLAEHRLLKRPCALKVIRPERAGDPRSLERFEHEVRATALLSDPNIVEVYDYGRTEDGTFFYVMEYLHGLSLDELVERHGPMPPGRVIYLLRQACEALAEAHAAGLIHRDLKPANLFAARRGRRYDFLKVLDFGLVEVVAARHEVGPSRERAVCGTPQYMAPEQITGDRAIDRRCDLYALGGVAYTLLTGRPPFAGETAAEVMKAHVRDPVVPPSHHRPDIPPDLEQVVLRCLAKDPDGRFQGAEELETGPLRLRVGPRVGCPEGGRLVGGVRGGRRSQHSLTAGQERALRRSVVIGGGLGHSRCPVGMCSRGRAAPGLRPSGVGEARARQVPADILRHPEAVGVLAAAWPAPRRWASPHAGAQIDVPLEVVVLVPVGLVGARLVGPESRPGAAVARASRL